MIMILAAEAAQPMNGWGFATVLVLVLFLAFVIWVSR